MAECLLQPAAPIFSAATWGWLVWERSCSQRDNFAIARLALYVIVVLSAMWVVLCGSRGALLATGVAGVALLFSARARITTKLLAVGGFSAASVLLFLNTQSGRTAIDVFCHRILHQTVEQRYTSSRDDLFTLAFELGLQRPVAGWGLGGFRANSWTYPHNLFLETFAEGGLIGIALLAIVFWTWWRSVKRSRQPLPGTTLAALFLMVTSACFSGNFYDSRGVFLLLALSIEPLASANFKPATARPIHRNAHAARIANTRGLNSLRAS